MQPTSNNIIEDIGGTNKANGMVVMQVPFKEWGVLIDVIFLIEVADPEDSLDEGHVEPCAGYVYLGIMHQPCHKAHVMALKNYVLAHR